MKFIAIALDQTSLKSRMKLLFSSNKRTALYLFYYEKNKRASPAAGAERIVFDCI